MKSQDRKRTAAQSSAYGEDDGLANTKIAQLRAISATYVKKRSRNYWLASPFVAPARSVRLVLVGPLCGGGCGFLATRTQRVICPRRATLTLPGPATSS